MAAREPLIVQVPTTPMLLYRGIASGLSKAQRTLLNDARDHTCSRHGADGVGVKGGRLRTAERLSSLGLIRYIGHGMALDGPDEKERACYEITDKGRGVLDAAERQGVERKAGDRG